MDNSGEEVDNVATTALVLASTAMGKARGIASLINQVEGTRSVHVIAEPCEIITVVEAEDSAGIYSVASKIASIPDVIRCVVCSERELAGDVETAGFARMTDDDYCCWCAREPSFQEAESWIKAE